MAQPLEYRQYPDFGTRPDAERRGDKWVNKHNSQANEKLNMPKFKV